MSFIISGLALRSCT